MTFVVPADAPRERADRLVTHLLGQAGRATTRAEVQRWIAEGRVLIDGKPPRRARAVPVGATITVRPGAPPPTAASPDPTVPFTVVFEDDHLLVVDKPAGVVVHPARGHHQGTLVQGLLAYRRSAERHAEPGSPVGADDLELGKEMGAPLPVDGRDPAGNQRPGIVHRLDKGTSGLLVVAKTAPVREALKALFEAHDIERCYTAIVVGPARSASYDTPYGRHPRSRLRFTSRATPAHGLPRRAVTHIEAVELLPKVSVVRCTLETGRTHQIRVHLAEQAGTPILGDPLYGPKPVDEAVRSVAATLGRQALHAGVLGFVHPMTGRPERWESPLPEDMRSALSELRAGATRPST